MFRVIAIISLVGILGIAVQAQTTEFTYQGSLKDGAAPANANYDFEFALYDALSAGSQIGTTIPKSNVPVTNGIFAVKLDFGSVFPGTDRYLEVRVRLAGQLGITTLAPRQLVNSSPYSVKSLNADQLGGVAAGEYVTATSGGTNYVQNTQTLQTASNFNIDGIGTALVFNANGEFRLGGNRTIGMMPQAGLVVGWGAGAANTTGVQNSFFGSYAGTSNTTGSYNSFFGRDAGIANTTGSDNSFFGQAAGWRTTTGSANTYFGSNSGQENTSGFENAFFGQFSGWLNTTGSYNSFFGRNAGRVNTTGVSNTFLGSYSGLGNVSGENNAFVGVRAGNVNTIGNNNTVLGVFADVGANNLNFASALGAKAIVNASDTIVLGKVAGTYYGVARPADTVVIPGNLIVNGTFSGALPGGSQQYIQNQSNGPQPNSNFSISGNGSVNGVLNANNIGIGTVTPAKRVHVLGAADQEIMIESSDAGGRKWTLQSSSGVSGGRFEIVDRTLNQGRLAILSSGAVGIGTTTPSNKLHLTAAGGNTLIGDPGCSAGFTGIGFGATMSGCVNYSMIGNGTDTIIGRPTGGFLDFRMGNITQASINNSGVFSILTLGAAGATTLCRNASNQISTCSSSLRYKTNIGNFSSGLAFINKLRPISFDWKEGRMKDVGFGAEDVARIDPRFVTYNDQGEVEGVKYDRLSVAFVNAFKEQQTQIETLRDQIKEQKAEIEAFKELVCSQNPTAKVCLQKN